ncbi:hypothetical protein ABFX02_07G020100 [Erythranthe guttata]
MEISVIGSSQVNVGRIIDVGYCSFSRNSNIKLFNSRNYNNSKACSSNLGRNQNLVCPSRSTVGFCLKASASAQNQAVVSEESSNITEPIEGTKLYVGLPLDTISKSNKINHARAIAAGLKALKLLGVEGVELPLYWGIVENEAMGEYNWTGYLAIIEIVQKLGLKLHLSVCFHASEEAKVSLPQWVSRIGESEPSIYFTDRSGGRYKDCLSLGADDVPVLDGKTPLEVYASFFENLKSSLSPFMGSTITGLSIGLGPNGELRYPSHHQVNGSTQTGAGEFQCYDKNMLTNLKNHSEKNGNPLWGLGGPHDAPLYNDQSPLSNGFFTENGGSWETPYGDFFLSWYSNELIHHGDQVLSLATSAFKDFPITISGKIPIIPSWHKSRSHPSELTAGVYNTVNRDGYGPVLEMFSRNSCRVVLPGMDLSDEAETLIAGITDSCKRNGVVVTGENTLVSGSPVGFEQMNKNLLGEDAAVDLFVYQRMGAYFFSPEHFPAFAQFFRGLSQPTQSLDDLPMEEDCENAESLCGMNRYLQTA